MINGKEFRDAVISGANHLYNNKTVVDELNVFPVPDGDTGTNMSLTLAAAVDSLENMEGPKVSEAADAAASAMLRGARGNSGVILSLLFRGISKSLRGKTELSSEALVDAINKGVNAAYKAVMKPTEGTILTVARMAGEHIEEVQHSTNDPVILFEEMLKSAEQALEKTPDMLPILKKAGVVDAGGKGLVILFEGMLKVLKGGKMIERVGEQTRKQRVNAAAEFDGEITFTYCTEFIANKKGAKLKQDSLALRAYLESIGDSVVVVDDNDIIKVHVHTDNPGNAIQEGLKFGPLTNLKIDNMRFQHEEKSRQAKKIKKQHEYVPVNPEIPYGFVAVGAGQGVHNLFSDLGVDKVIQGGQTMNPSTEDILAAIHSVPAEQIFVLPNNKNIIMSAEQAIKLADRKVCVIQTRTIPQGIAAMMAFDSDAGFSENKLAMTKALGTVDTGLITFAAHDSDFEGHKIKKGEILAIENSRLTFTDKEINKAAYKLIKSMYKRDSQFVTIIYGADVTDEKAERLYETVSDKLGSSAEVSLINGGQPVYYYIVSVE